MSHKSLPSPSGRSLGTWTTGFPHSSSFKGLHFGESIFLFSFLFFLFVFLFRAAPAAYGSSLARGGIQAASATYTISSPQHGILNPQSEARDWIHISWIVVGLFSAEPQREIQSSSFHFPFMGQRFSELDSSSSTWEWGQERRCWVLSDNLVIWKGATIWLQPNKV